jgi:hypothetical protein
VKIWVRAVCRPESRPSTNGELAEIVQREGVVAPGDVLQPLLHTAVVLGVDDALVAVVRPRVRAGRAQLHAALGGEREQAPAAVALGEQRRGEVVAATGADLDLRGDQLPGERVREDGIGRRGGVAQLLEARHERERRRVEDRELLLQPDRALGRVREQLVGGVEVETHRRSGPAPRGGRVR